MITTEQLAADLGVSARQVQRLRGAGMPCLPVGARSVRYDAAACRQWLSANQEHLSTCLSSATAAAGSRSLSASAVSAYTAACRRAQLRVMPSE
jgi:hypothetical protein